MYIASDRLRAHVESDVSRTIEVRLHSGDPGTTNVDNLISLASLTNGSWPSIMPEVGEDKGWTAETVADGYAVHSREDVLFGAAVGDLTVSWLTLWRDSVYYAKRPLKYPQEIVGGAPVAIVGRYVRIHYRSDLA